MGLWQFFFFFLSRLRCQFFENNGLRRQLLISWGDCLQKNDSGAFSLWTMTWRARVG